MQWDTEAEARVTLRFRLALPPNLAQRFVERRLLKHAWALWPGALSIEITHTRTPDGDPPGRSQPLTPDDSTAAVEAVMRLLEAKHDGTDAAPAG